MKTKELITKLKHYNAWRRGANTAPSEPKHIGEWIDEACEKLSNKDTKLKIAAKEAVFALDWALCAMNPPFCFDLFLQASNAADTLHGVLKTKNAKNPMLKKPRTKKK